MTVSIPIRCPECLSTITSKSFEARTKKTSFKSKKEYKLIYAV